MARARYLADTSVFGRLTKAPVATAFAPLAAEGAVGVCAPVVFELGYATRNSADYVALTDRLNAFPAVVVTEADHQRALEVQAALVAATAEARDLAILHYDADFELIASVTGQSHQWIVTRGTAD